MALSASVLFHFTNTLENLVNILTNEFRPHFCLEDFAILSRRAPPASDMRIAVPMVSFCDIPLSQVARHMDTYGYYALGLAKQWGMSHGLAPVLYAHPNAITARAVSDLARSVKSNSPAPATGQVSKSIMSHLVKILFLTKPYEGTFFHRDQVRQNVRFYDEREWRFIPFDEDYVPALRESAFLEPEARAQANNELAEYRLSFTPRDIKYVIVREDSEILPIIREMERIKGSKYSRDDVTLLSSRVISSKQVIEDF